MSVSHAESPGADISPEQRRALIAIGSAELLALSLWFSATAVAPQLDEAWQLTEAASSWLTLAVQLGFVVGAFAGAVTGVADAISSRYLFAATALAGALLNATLVVLEPDHVAIAIALRFGTGLALAGVYPSGLKVMSGWFTAARGMALGVLVGALVVGSALPHLVRATGLAWQGVILAASALATIAAVIVVRFVGDGPHEVAPSPFSWGQIGTVVRSPGFRLSTVGYLGHMWELYAMWAWTGAFLLASAQSGGYSTDWVPLATFATIAVGGIGAWRAGVAADRIGRERVASMSLVASGSVAIVTPLVFGWHPVPLVVVFLFWGYAVVADSAQFSALVTETTSATHRGTALTLQTALGFLLTLVTIRGVPLIADAIGWRWSFLWLALGPVVGIVAMQRLSASRHAATAV